MFLCRTRIIPEFGLSGYYFFFFYLFLFIIDVKETSLTHPCVRLNLLSALEKPYFPVSCKISFLILHSQEFITFALQ